MSDTNKIATAKIPKLPNKNKLVGYAFEVSKNPVYSFHKYAQQYGKIYYMPVYYPINLCIVTDPEIIKYILVTNNKNFHKGRAYTALREVLGNGLLTSEGDFWLRQRRMTQPAFHKNRIEHFATIMANSTQEMIADWEKKEQAFKINIADFNMKLTMDIVSKALFNIDKEYDKQAISDAVSLGNHYIDWRIDYPFPFVNKLPIKIVREYHKMQATMDKLIYDFIEERQLKKENNSNDLLSMYMEAKDEETGEGMSKKQLRDEVLTVFVAGHETTAVTLSWFWLLMCQNPQVMKKVYDEIDQVIGTRPPNFNDFQKLSYLNLVINETMRVYPAAWIVGRKAMQDDILPGGYPIKKGQDLQLFIYGVHHNEQLWERPNDFIPERFEPENNEKRHKHAFMPFGSGPRLCIGNNFALMELVMVIATIAQKFTFELVQSHPIELEPLVTLRPKFGIELIVHKR